MAGFSLFKRKEKRDRAAEAAAAEAESLARLEFSRLDPTNLLAEPILVTSTRPTKETNVTQDAPAGGIAAIGTVTDGFSLMDDILGTLMASSAPKEEPPVAKPEPAAAQTSSATSRNADAPGNAYKVYKLGQSKEEAEPELAQKEPKEELSAHDIVRFLRGESERKERAARGGHAEPVSETPSSRPHHLEAPQLTSRSGSVEAANRTATGAAQVPSQNRGIKDRYNQLHRNNSHRIPSPPLTPTSSRDDLKGSPLRDHGAEISERLSSGRSRSRSGQLTTSPSSSPQQSMDRPLTHPSLSRSRSTREDPRQNPSPIPSDDSRGGRWGKGLRRRSSSNLDLKTSSRNSPAQGNDVEGPSLSRRKSRSLSRSRSRSRSRNRLAHFFGRGDAEEGNSIAEPLSSRAPSRQAKSGRGTPAVRTGDDSDDDQPLAVMVNSVSAKLRDHAAPPADTVVPSMRRSGHGTGSSSPKGTGASLSRRASDKGLSASLSADASHGISMSRQLTADGGHGRRRHNSSSARGTSSHPHLPSPSPAATASMQALAGVLAAGSAEGRARSSAPGGDAYSGNVENWVRSVNAVTRSTSQRGSPTHSPSSSPVPLAQSQTSTLGSRGTGRSRSQGPVRQKSGDDLAARAAEQSGSVHISKRTGRAAALAAAAAAANLAHGSGSGGSTVSSSLATGSSLTNLTSGSAETNGSSNSPPSMTRRQLSFKEPSVTVQEPQVTRRRSKREIKTGSPQVPAVADPNGAASAAAALLNGGTDQQQQLAALTYIAQIAAAAQYQQQIQLQMATYSNQATIAAAAAVAAAASATATASANSAQPAPPKLRSRSNTANASSGAAVPVPPSGPAPTPGGDSPAPAIAASMPAKKKRVGSGKVKKEKEVPVSSSEVAGPQQI
ncbi:hypothetical protein HDU96_007359 [Phlyctochytrium bullatum]|nr:hypothetical protein HDU96_007359 [Phlyctochytrium bullatum]